VKDEKFSAIFVNNAGSDLKKVAVIMIFIAANPPGAVITLKILDENSKELCSKKVDAVYTKCSFILSEAGNKKVNVLLSIMDIKSGHEEKHERNFEIIN